MIRSVPEYSPRMLKDFLRFGAEYRWLSAPVDRRHDATVARYKSDIRKAARVSELDFDLAWRGKLLNAVARLKLWAVLNVRPADLGVRLLDDGGQEVIE